MKKFIAIILMFSMLAAAFSCANNTGKISDETAADSSSAAEETEDSYIYDDLPNTDFEGEELHILTTTWYSASTYIYAESLDGEVINDALYNARSKISDRFNVTISLTANDWLDVVSNNTHKMVMAGDTSYDLVYNHDLKTVGNALKGDFINIRSIDAINFSKPWWNGSSETFTVNGKLLFTANFLSLSGIYMNYVLAVNKELAADNTITIPYEKVKAGEWYFDDLISITKDTARDIDGDGRMTENDQYGFLTSYYGDMGMQSDLGGTVISKDSEGYLVYEPDLERIVDIFVQVDKLYENGENKYGEGNEYGADLFMNNQGLFTFSENRVLYTKVRSSDIVYGILPFPKFDETQEDYRSSGCDIYWGIPITVADRKEMIGTLVEAMSCFNYNNIVPQVWELVLGSKLSDSPDDAEMFEIIRDVQYVDLGYAFSGESSALTNLIFLFNATDSGSVSSYIEKYSEKLVTDLKKINDKFDTIS